MNDRKQGTKKSVKISPSDSAIWVVISIGLKGQYSDEFNPVSIIEGVLARNQTV